MRRSRKYLKKPSTPEVHREACAEPGAARPVAARPLDAEAHPVVQHGAEPEQRREPPADVKLVEGPGEELPEELERVPDEEAPVEGVARDEQPELARAVRAQRPVDAEDRQEDPEEAQLDEEDGPGELHGASPTSAGGVRSGRRRPPRSLGRAAGCRSASRPGSGGRRRCGARRRRAREAAGVREVEEQRPALRERREDRAEDRRREEHEVRFEAFGERHLAGDLRLAGHVSVVDPEACSGASRRSRRYCSSSSPWKGSRYSLGWKPSPSGPTTAFSERTRRRGTTALFRRSAPRPTRAAFHTQGPRWPPNSTRLLATTRGPRFASGARAGRAQMRC